MNLSHFALARDLLKHIDEEVPTHFSRVGRISGCIIIIYIPQTSNAGPERVLKHIPNVSKYGQFYKQCDPTAIVISSSLKAEELHTQDTTQMSLLCDLDL